MTTNGLRVLCVHAHPDDETITTGGTIASLTAGGATVRVLTCTLGEHGEVLGEEFAGLVAEDADQLGGYRIAELRAALAHLGVPGPHFLGGAGKWRDSGMAGTPPASNPRAFINAGSAAVADMVAEIDDFRPDLIITYDPQGGYGHPDHIQAHEVTMAALPLCTHRPQRLAWTVSAELDANRLHPAPPAGFRSARPGELPGYPDSAITHRVDLDEAALAAKLAALGEHATQLELVGTDDPSNWFFALTNHVLQPVVATEYFITSTITASGELEQYTGPPAELFDRCGGDTGRGDGTRVQQ